MAASSFVSRKTLALALAAGGAVTALLGGQTAKAQSGPGAYASPADTIRYYGNNEGSANSTSTINYAAGALERLDAKKAATVNPYVAKAQAIFATDANGNYKNARVGQIVSDTIKLYNQAGPQYEHTPGSYPPLQQYFDKLKPGQEQNIMLVVLDDLLPPTMADQRKFPVGNDLLGAIIPDYAKYLGFLNKHGYFTIADYCEKDVLKRPVSNDPQGEATRIAFASVLRMPYPIPAKQNNTTIALYR